MGMKISKSADLTKVELDGRLDSGGVDIIELQFTAGIVPQEKPTIVDLSQVTFLASLGIRMLISTARALNARGAKMVLYGAVPAVMDILENTSLSTIIPVADTEEDAMKVVLA